MNEKGRKANSPFPIFLLVLLVAGILLCGLSLFFDEAISVWVKLHSVKLLNGFARFLSAYGDWPQLMVFAIVGLGIAALIRKQALVQLLVCMMISSSIAGALVNTLRLTSGRARPNYAEAPQEWNGLWHGKEFLLFNNKYHSFPSGHSAAASAFFGVPLFARRTYGRWTFLIAIAIGWSRVYLNVHRLSDVLVGILIGTVTAYFVWACVGPLIEKRLRFRSFG